LEKLNEKVYVFVTCRVDFEHKKKQNFAYFSKMEKKVFHRAIWSIAHLENLNFKNVTFSIGLLAGFFEN